MNKFFLPTILLLLSQSVVAQVEKVFVQSDDSGMKLVVNGEDFMINGMNWDYFPTGTNYEYSLWNQPEDFIIEALDNEMTLLKDMGVNTLRQYSEVPPKWIQYIYENYGIYTMLNHSFGRYGLTLDGEWVANTDYANPKVKELLIAEVTELASEYGGTPGLLLYLLGNENNYGLFWEGAETENIPKTDDDGTIRARALYKLFNEAVLAMKTIDPSHPIAICNGDLQFLDIIQEECGDVDIFGTNMYRGVSFGKAFQDVKDKLNKPILFTEFGADAYNASNKEEDQKSQAYYFLGNWKEIYQNAAGLGKAENSLGGFTFQFSDGWWKFGQTVNLDVHDTNASWANGGYSNDLEEGKNNMNEEWFGVCAKEVTDSNGFYSLSPRAAYYTLLEVHKLNPYSMGTDLQDLDKHFSGIQITDGFKKAKK